MKKLFGEPKIPDPFHCERAKRAAELTHFDTADPVVYCQRYCIYGIKVGKEKMCLIPGVKE